MSVTDKDGQTTDTKWGWPLKELYRHGLAFYKGNDCSFLFFFLSCVPIRECVPVSVSLYVLTAGVDIRVVCHPFNRLIFFCAVCRRNSCVNDHIIKNHYANQHTVTMKMISYCIVSIFFLQQKNRVKLFNSAMRTT